MSLLAQPSFNCTALQPFPVPIIMRSEALSLSIAPSVQNTTIKTGEFVRGITSFLSSKQAAPLACAGALSTFLQDISSFSPEKVRQSLFKKSGYVSRFFSHESWAEWTEHRTALGRVVALFEDFTQSSTSLRPFLQRLDRQTLQQADVEAATLLEECHYSAQPPALSQEASTVLVGDCSVSLVLGSIGSLATESPLPLGVAALNCLEGAAAQRGNPNVATANRHQNRREQILQKNYERRKQAGIKEDPPSSTAGKNPKPSLELINRVREAFRQEVAGQHKEAIERVSLQGVTWMDFLFFGLELVLDDLGVTTPVNVAKQKFVELDQYYWLNTVYVEYTKIFPTPECLSQPANRNKYEIQTMKDKLVQHGYTLHHGTPLQFLEHLNRARVCERAVCTHDEL